MEFYALRHKQTCKMMGLTIVINTVEESCDYDEYVHLTPIDSPDDDCPLYTAFTRKDAERVANRAGRWYKSTSKNPANNYVGELEVVKFTMMVV
jgi:hypothetical protein